MNKVLDIESYKHSYSHRMAYVEGKLDLCEEIIGLAHIIMARNRISPFKPTTEYEEGQIAAMSAIIESVASIQKTTETRDLDENSVQYDA